MEELQLTIDECIDWVKSHVPLYKQSRSLIEICKATKIIDNSDAVIRALDPKNFMFIDIDVYYQHIEMIKDLAETQQTDWTGLVEHQKWIDRNQFSVHEWLKYYLNPNLFTEENIAQLPVEICAIMLTQLKSWYIEDPDIQACCLIEYIDQIKLLLLRSMSADFIVIYNELAAAYTNRFNDCNKCEVKGRKNKREKRWKLRS